MLKLIAEIVAANVISKTITSPSKQQLSAEEEKQFQIEKERIVRAKADAVVSDLIASQKDITPEQVLAYHKAMDEQVNKFLLADKPKVSSNMFAIKFGFFLLGIFCLYSLVYLK